MNRQTSPFKFLDSYEQKDAAIFFGREEETENLYNALSGVKHLLVYGPSGAGKTSLIECGLRNQFSDADWFALSIRKGENMIASVFSALNAELEESISLDEQTGLPLDETLEWGHLVENLYSERFQPVYLLFDQFEELLISGTEEEKIGFFSRLNALIRYRVPCRVILIMREEFVGHLSEFEPLCPTIFHHRFRLEKMTRLAVQKVVSYILEAEAYKSFFISEDSEALSEKMLEKLPDNREEIELAYVQVFLSELWARSELNELGKAVLHEGLIQPEDNLQRVLDAFLKKQLTELAPLHGEKIPLEVLASMISERHTKLQMGEKDIQRDLLQKEVEMTSSLRDLLEVFTERRILRVLRSGNEIQYEISHDVLAKVVGLNLTEEIQLREKAREIYRVYRERKGYLTTADLDLLRPYESYASYPPELATRIQESETYIQKERQQELQRVKGQREKEEKLRKEAERQAEIAQKNARTARQRTRIASLVAVLALVTAITAGWYYQEADREKDKNRQALERIQQQQVEKVARELASYGDT
ncbi:MAG: ATP-binding protein, partial [Bacteroidota bacterium]